MSEAIRNRIRYLGEKGRWIPWAFVGFFLVVILVNVVMMVFAFSTWPGLSTRNHYLEGLAYNERLEAERRQAALGWQVDLAARLGEGRQVAVVLQAADAAGAPLLADSLEVRFRRPAQEGYDFTGQARALAPGRYGLEVEMPLPGLWDLQVEIGRGADRYELTRRLVARP